MGAFGSKGEAFFRLQEAKHALDALGGREPRVVSFGGGAVTSPSVREALHETAFTVLLDVEPGEAWRRVGGTRPLAQDEQQFRSLYAERDPLYRGDRGRGRLERRLGRRSCSPRPACTTSAARSSGSASSCRATARSRSSPTRP